MHNKKIGKVFWSGIFSILVIAFICGSSLVFAQTSTQSGTGTSSLVVNTQIPVTGRCGATLIPNVNTLDYEIDWQATFYNLNIQDQDYHWTGTDGLNENGIQVQKHYSTPGLKNATVTVSIGNSQTLSLNCSVNIVNPITPTGQNLGASCQPSIASEQVTWNTSVYNSFPGTSPTIAWSGTDGLTGSTTQVDFNYPSDGIKTANLNITNNGQSLSMSCQSLIASSTNSSRCFIATAAYGSPMEPDVMVLRNFRDEILLKNDVGKKFVDAYYKVSPPIADFIREHDSLRAVVRVGLAPIINELKNDGYGSK